MNPSPGDPNKSKGERTRQSIIEAAYQVFMEHGYHAASMRQIVERAGVTMGGIYNHFSSKEAIWIEVFRAKHPYHDILPLLTHAGGNTIEDFAHSTARRLVEGLENNHNLLNLMFIELVEFKGIHLGLLYEDILPEITSLREVFATKKGYLRPYPLPLLARTFAGLFFSYYITERIMPPQARALMGDDPLKAYVNIYLHGVMEEAPEAEHG